ncbi:MAG: FKBP-type peptidyl-prolyl cis-trans isomerase [Bacteroidales bacterium]|nr:FKBP-type peptidyl-prolyl cis-trans isomerase [Candidatus Colimorpha merdihippi]MCQ2282820.1 FKBP-type peptidyl-prolyl cis-trans isomerase [Bacteroidales bacterium]
MKKVLSIALAAMTCAVLMTACNQNYKKTANGLEYRFETTVADGQQPQAGDLLVGELVLRLENDTLFTNAGKPDRIFQVAERTMFKGDIQEGLLMMHVGDKAIFKIPADSIASFMGANQMPKQYQQGAGQSFYYEISLMDIVTKDELAQEQANYVKEMETRKENEAATLAKYIADNNITAKPTQSGLYIIVNEKGNGPKVAQGKMVTVNYTGRTVEGNMFDTSREADAKEGGIYMQGREYKPFSYTVGEQPMIKGWEEGLMGQAAGTKLTLVIPSEIGYGARGAGKDIQPYTSLVFNITIESVE